MNIDQLCEYQLFLIAQSRYKQGWDRKRIYAEMRHVDYLIKRNCQESYNMEALLVQQWEQMQPKHRYGLSMN